MQEIIERASDKKKVQQVSGKVNEIQGSGFLACKEHCFNFNLFLFYLRLCFDNCAFHVWILLMYTWNSTGTKVI